jgi:hypothetical protein
MHKILGSTPGTGQNILILQGTGVYVWSPHC